MNDKGRVSKLISCAFPEFKPDISMTIKYGENVLAYVCKEKRARIIIDDNKITLVISDKKGNEKASSMEYKNLWEMELLVFIESRLMLIQK